MNLIQEVQLPKDNFNLTYGIMYQKMVMIGKLQNKNWQNMD